MPQNSDILYELKTFHKELESYRDLYERLLVSEGQLSQHQERRMKTLREKLVGKTSVLKATITALTGKQYYTRFGQTHEIWNDGLSPLDYPEIIRDALALCVDVTNEAIGKLKDDIDKGIRDKQGNVIGKPPIISTEPPKAFIAHGGDSPALRKLKSFLEALGVQPLIVEEQPSEGRSVGENVDYYAKQADCAIILATKGDIDGKTGEFIPRGNVLIEIGKSQELFKDRIIYLIQAGTKLPTNIDEKVRARFTSENMDDAFIKIAKELNKFGIIKAIKS